MLLLIIAAAFLLLSLVARLFPVTIAACILAIRRCRIFQFWRA
jgi:hypothetical protein